MLELILGLLAVPLFVGTFLIFAPSMRESTISRWAITTSSVYGSIALTIVCIWLFHGQRHESYVIGNLYESGEYRFTVSFLLDSLSCLWIFMVAFLSGVVIKFSHIYMHKEDGYQRFFACLMFLIFGLTLLAVAGGLDLLMAGWEFVGICSFLLIGFYQYRTTSVRNAFKVYSVYRFCDAGLLLSAWLAHVLWHDGQTFVYLRSPEAIRHLADVGQASLNDMTALILLAAAGKSAQFPFTFWLSRAMEGPTPSSAIFYGALSVHAGVFLLFRTYPIWHAADYGPWMVGGLGFITVIVGSGISRAQSNIKGQIAYSSAVHVGMMFIELALGFKDLAMFHMFGNACLRCYQLLVSPSSVVYLLRLQGSQAARSARRTKSFESMLPKRIAATLYVFAMNDGFLEGFVRRILWRPMTIAGRWVQKYTRILYFGIIPLIFIAEIYWHGGMTTHVKIFAVFVAAITGVTLTLSALVERQSYTNAWHAIAVSNVMAGLAIWILEGHVLNDLLLFASGIVVFWIIGWQALLYLTSRNPHVTLNKYQGLSASHPGGALVLFVAVLGMTGFPISPTFIGQDVMLHHAVDDYVWLALMLAFIFAVNGLALMRIYAKICLGSVSKNA